MNASTKRRLTAGLLSLCLPFCQGIFPLSAYAEGTAAGGLCEHHPEHTAGCGYAEGTPCSHEHTGACYQLTGQCVHIHTEECYPEGKFDGDKPAACAHVCSAESGCLTNTLNCQHAHDGECGYTESHACEFACKDCGASEIQNSTECSCTAPCSAEQAGCPVCKENPENCIATQADDLRPGHITGWEWIDPGNALNAGVLVLPGMSADNQADFQTVSSMLPEKISATAGGGEMEIPLDGWQCSAFRQDNAHNWPVEGEYTFIAALPDGYTLSESAEPLHVTVRLTGAANVLQAEDTGAFQVTGNSAGYKYSADNHTLTILDGAKLTISGTSTEDKIIVQKNATADITIEKLSIDVSKKIAACAFDVSDATVTLTLKDANVLKSGYNRAGLQKNGGNGQLNILGNGSLEACGGEYGAGIGGTSSSAENITIKGGTVTAYGGKYGAGIGGGDANYITISGNSTVTAYGGDLGAGIGGGSFGKGSNIAIESSVVTAIGGNDAAGIGGGGNSDHGVGTNITIQGSETVVIAQGNRGVEKGGVDNIGSGFQGSSSSNIQKNGGMIIEGNEGALYGSNVTLTQDLEIKSGVKVTVGSGKTLTVAQNTTLTNRDEIVNEGTIVNNGTLVNYGTITGAAITGSGVFTSTYNGLTVTTSAGAPAYQDSDGQIILGSGTYSISGTWTGTLTNISYGTPKAAVMVKRSAAADITIEKLSIDVSKINYACAFNVSGATVTLTLKDANVLKSGENCAGLQKNGSSGRLNISGDGSLETCGGENGAGIGSGSVEDANNITMSGNCTVTAYGGNKAAGIGGGNSGNAQNIVISGNCTVTAIGGDEGAGIGGGSFGNGIDITIERGVVTAIGGNDAAGIGGGGCYGTGNDITIQGSETVVIARGNGGVEKSGVENIGSGVGGNIENNRIKKDGGMIIEGNTGALYGNVTLKQDLEIKSGVTVTIADGQTLTIDTGVKLTNNGKIINKGNIVNNGTISGSGTIASKSAVSVSFSSQTIRYGDTITITATAQDAAGPIRLLRTVDAQYVDFWINDIGGSGTRLNPEPIPVQQDGETFTASYTVTLSGGNWSVGKYTILADFGGTGNLLDSTGSAEITIQTGLGKIDIFPLDKTYDGSPVSPILDTHGSSGATTLTWYSGTSPDSAAKLDAPPADAGTYTLAAKLAADTYYEQATSHQTFTIAKAPVTVKAIDRNIQIGSAIPDFTTPRQNVDYTVTGLVGMDTLTQAPALTYSAPPNNTKAGSYPIVISGAGVGSNYSVHHENGTLTIAARPLTGTLTVSGTAKVGSALTAELTASNNTGKLSYAWRNGQRQIGDGQTYTPVSSDAGSPLTVEVTSSVESGKLSAQTAVIAASSGNGGGGGSDNDSGGQDRDDRDDGSSSGTVTVTTPPSTAQQPSPPTNGETKVDGAVSQNGNATVTVPDTSIRNAIKAAKKQAGKNGVSVSVNISLLRTANSLTVTISKDALDQLIAENVKELKILSTLISLRFDLDALKEIRNSVADKWMIQAQKLDVQALSEAAQAEIGSRPVFGLSMQSGNKDITGFGAGSASVWIPYAPDKDEETDNIQAVYVDKDGNVSVIPGSSYDLTSKSVLFSTNHFSVYGVGYKRAAPSFTDTGEHWAKGDIAFVAAKGLLSGTENNQFLPDTATTRAMFVTALGRLAAIDKNSYQTGKFTDVESTAYYAPFVSWAAENGITNGDSSTTFGPGKPVTRQEMAVFMYNYAKAKGYTLPENRQAVTFADDSAIASWAAEAVRQMQMVGVINGKDGKLFDPTGTATRAEVSAVLRRFIELVIDPAIPQS